MTEHQHKEAYRTMLYRCPRGHMSLIWNSRDGVTPFGILCRTHGCQETSTHVHWELDCYEPTKVLRSGDLYWRDGTPEEARAIIRRRLELARGTDYERPESEWESIIAEVTKTPEDPKEHHEFSPGWPELDVFQKDELPELSPPDEAPSNDIWTSSGYGAQSRQPFVDIHYRDNKVQLHPDDARAFALTVVEAAEAAEQDAFLIEWLQQTVKVGLNEGLILLREYRQYRSKRIKEANEARRVITDPEDTDGV